MSLNNIINNILLGNVFEYALNHLEYIFEIINNKKYCYTFINRSINRIFSFIINDNNIIKNINNIKEDDYIYPLPRSNSIYRIKDRDDLIDNGPIEI